MSRQHLENTPHTGLLAYVEAPGLLELEYPVLMRVLNDKYEPFIGKRPIIDPGDLFFRIWDPTPAMEKFATQVLRTYYGHGKTITKAAHIWQVLKRIHLRISFASAAKRREAREEVIFAAADLSIEYGENVLPATLASAAKATFRMKTIAPPNGMAASVTAASLMLMAGVRPEQIAVFGFYYLDPVDHSHPKAGWHNGFVVGSPYYVTLGVCADECWIPVDMTMAGILGNTPRPHLRPANLGLDPRRGAHRLIDYRHPYTMIFAPRTPNHARLSRIPLLEV